MGQDFRDRARLVQQQFVCCCVLCALAVVLSYAFAFQVDEGGRVPLLAHHHLAADYDTAAKKDLRVAVIALPMYGYIENTKTGKVLGYLFFHLADERERRNCRTGACSNLSHHGSSVQCWLASVDHKELVRSALRDQLSLGSISS